MTIQKRGNAMNDTMGFHLYDMWITNLRRGKLIDSFFRDNLYNSIAIYGMGMIGRQLYEELKESQIIVEYAIDRNAIQIHSNEVKTITVGQIKDMKKVDAIIVTPFDQFVDIEKILFQVVDKEIDIISIEWIIRYISKFGEVK